MQTSKSEIQFTITTKDKNPCIYAIMNNKNFRIYVGESKKPMFRFAQHKSTLKAGVHANKELQRDYDNGDSFTFLKLRDYEEDEIETIRYYELLYMDMFSENGIELYNYETEEQVKRLLKYESSEHRLHCLMRNKRDEYYKKYFGVTYYQFITFDMLSKQKGRDDYLKYKIEYFTEKRKEEIEREKKEKRKQFLKDHKKISFFIKKDIYKKLETITDNPEEYICKTIEKLIERGVWNANNSRRKQKKSKRDNEI